jgi:hypothetical protein
MSLLESLTMDEINVKEMTWVKNDIEYLTMAYPTDKG